MILTVAACEASIALALILILYNRRSSLDVTLWQEIREPGSAARRRRRRGGRGRVEAVAGPETYPHLTPAGVEPDHPDRNPGSNDAIEPDFEAGRSVERSEE